MASSSLFITVLLSVAPIFFQPGLSQGPSPPASCASLLFALAPCAPFVQGFVQIPAQPCCNSLSQIYNQQPTCLCLFLDNNSTLSPAFPINQTLALQLPQLCSIQANSSICSPSSGASSVAAPPTSSPTGSQVSLGAKNISDVAAATPVAPQVAPKPTSMKGVGYGLKSSGPESKIHLTMVVIAATLTGAHFLI